MTLENEIKKAEEKSELKKVDFENKISKLEKQVKIYTFWAWSFVIIGFLISAYGLIDYKCNGSFELNLLGDFLGGAVASIWSLAGLFFIYVAFLGQKQQLLNQQMELMFSQLEVKYTRLEIKGQKQEMIEQNRTLRQQRFENTFFQLLRNHQEIVNGIDMRKKVRGTGEMAISEQGRDCFKIFYQRFSGNLNKNVPLDKILTSYMEFFDKHQADLGHYFRNLYHILKFVKNSEEITPEEKFKYSSLLRALLSSYELTLLFYNGLGKYGVEFFKPLIEEFSFLKNNDKKLLIDTNHMNEYDELAFADSKTRKKILKERMKNGS